MTDRFDGLGEGIGWLRAHADHHGNDCLEWPKGRSRGYGQVCTGHCKVEKAHRVMCEIVHGAPPAPGLEAAHSCHNKGCVNPDHLSWETRPDNQNQSVKVGRYYRDGRNGRLNREKAAQIRALKDELSQDKIAAQFGVTHSTVAKIHRNEIWRI